MTNVLIIGATSLMGQVATKYFLDKTDDNITLMARYTDLLDTNAKRERVFQGDIIDEEVLDTAMRGNDVVLLTLDSNQERIIQKVVDAMQRQHVERLLFLTSMGICNEVPITPGASGDLTDDSLLEPYAEGIAVVEASGLNYTIIRPSWLDNGKDVDNYEVVHNGKPFNVDQVSRGSVADFIVRLAHNNKMSSHDDVAISRKA